MLCVTRRAVAPLRPVLSLATSPVLDLQRRRGALELIILMLRRLLGLHSNSSLVGHRIRMPGIKASNSSSNSSLVSRQDGKQKRLRVLRHRDRKRT
mgnify:CR=1